MLLALLLAACGDDGGTDEPPRGGRDGSTDEPPSGGGGEGGGGGTSGRGCLQGTFAIESSVRGSGFGAYDGHEVEARLAGEELSALVENGRFSFEFSLPSSTCNLGANRYEGGALYVDVDGDGTCSAATDLIFVWVASGGASPSSNTDEFTPHSSRCPELLQSVDSSALASAQALCPDLGSCLDFCEPSDLLGVGGFAAVCPFPPDGGADDDAGSTDARDE